ncbi:HNH endonuclease [Tropicimonas marinistellae]|uniref:HNH endonuclease n=1 Tax=Tropicimonas marinistellae TaxID=1739787 RepID=UPI00082A4005|nr:HNH endonuclease signature motif containing protein [Tropicimonas marinistellae]
MGRLKAVKPRLAQAPSRVAGSGIKPSTVGVAHPFSTRRGRKVRDAVVQRDLCLCQMCGCIVVSGRSDPRAAIVDHVRPWRLMPELRYVLSNLRLVCRDCHAVCLSIEARFAGDAEMIAAEKLKLTHQT